MSEFVTLTLIIALFSLIQSVFELVYSCSEPQPFSFWVILTVKLCGLYYRHRCRSRWHKSYGQHQLVESKRNVFALTLPSAAAGTLIIFQLEAHRCEQNSRRIPVDYGLLRSSSVLKNNLDLLITKHPKAIFLSTGLIHGLSNMGGGLLSFLMASIHKNKLNIRTNIAFVYCCFCFLQLILLSLFKAEKFNLY